MLPSNRHIHNICVLSDYVQSNCLRDAVLVDLNGIFAHANNQSQWKDWARDGDDCQNLYKLDVSKLDYGYLNLIERTSASCSVYHAGSFHD